MVWECPRCKKVWLNENCLDCENGLAYDTKTQQTDKIPNTLQI